MKVFVTGACGFIGSHLAEALVREGHDVTAMAIISARDTFGWLDEIYPIEMPPTSFLRTVRGDVRDAEQMRALIKAHDIVFHLAALGSVPYSYEAPRSFIDTNVTGTLNVLEACKETGAKLVHTSTSEVYGTALYTPQDINHPLQAQSPYAASKIAADKLVEAYTRTYGMDTVTLRPFNSYGPRQSERAVIPHMIRQALDPTCRAIEIGDPDPCRDLTYVTDTVSAFLAVMGLNGCWNAGAGASIRIGAVSEFVGQMTGGEKKIVCRPDLSRPSKSEVYNLVADAEPLLRYWTPKVSLTQGIAETIDWWREREFRPDVGMVT